MSLQLSHTDLLKHKYLTVLNDILTIQPATNLVVVSKNTSIENILILYHLGQRDFGENRVEQLLERSISLKDLNINWHYIGNLQTNKVSKLKKVLNLKYIHSVDSKKLLIKLENNFKFDQIKIFLQVNTSEEEQKNGFLSIGELEDIVSSYDIFGLMTMASTLNSNDKNIYNDAKNCFTKLSDIKNKLDFSKKLGLKLSMGMSRDYKIALSCGSDFIRVGSILFKEY